MNGSEFEAGELLQFDQSEGEIEIINTAAKAIDIFLFGGEEYEEPMVSEGPFVMNSLAEIKEAYRDFYDGKYGEIKPDN